MKFAASPDRPSTEITTDNLFSRDQESHLFAKDPKLRERKAVIELHQEQVRNTRNAEVSRSNSKRKDEMSGIFKMNIYGEESSRTAS